MPVFLDSLGFFSFGCWIFPFSFAHGRVFFYFFVSKWQNFLLEFLGLSFHLHMAGFISSSGQAGFLLSLGRAVSSSRSGRFLLLVLASLLLFSLLGSVLPPSLPPPFNAMRW